MTHPITIPGTPVRNLQTMLRELSFTDPRILPVIPDGFYSGITAASVRSFQETAGLPPTGITEYATWNQIADRYAVSTVYPPALQPVWDTGTVLQAGDNNLHLYLVQAMLHALSHYFTDLNAPILGATLNPETIAGLQWIQRAGGLSETGALNTKTWNILTDLYRIVIGDGTVP